jgi:hypothetical protein
MVEGVSLPRMLIGTNWMMGYSHKSASADTYIRQNNKNTQAVADIIEAFLESGVNAIMGCISQEETLQSGIKLAEDRTGKGVVRIDTPLINVENTAEGRREAEKRIKLVKEGGAAFCMPHHSAVEQLVCKHTQTIDRLPDYLKMIRDNDMIPGLSAHMPELIVYSDENEYDVQTYIQIFNCMGFLMQVEIEYIHRVIMDAKKPVMTIKPMAAGRVSPFVGLTFSYAALRDCDMVTVGCMTPQEAREDVEIALAVLERRSPDIEGRGSPSKTSVMK